jgi:hypothetical protein
MKKKKKKCILQLKKYMFFNCSFLVGPLALLFKDDL